MALVMATKQIEGADLLAEGRELLRKFRAQGLRVPKVTIEGIWLMNGFTFNFEDAEDAFPPFGNKYVKAGAKKTKVEPTDESVMVIYTVAEGEPLNPNAKLAKLNLLDGLENAEQGDDDEEQSE